MGRPATAVVAPGGYGLTIMPNPSPDARSGSRRLAVGAVATAAVVLAAILIGSGLAGAALPVATDVALASGGATLNRCHADGERSDRAAADLDHARPNARPRRLRRPRHRPGTRARTVARRSFPRMPSRRG